MGGTGCSCMRYENGVGGLQPAQPPRDPVCDGDTAQGHGSVAQQAEVDQGEAPDPPARVSALLGGLLEHQAPSGLAQQLVAIPVATAVQGDASPPPALAGFAEGPGARHRQLVQTWQRESVRAGGDDTPVPPLSPILTEGAEELGLDGPGHPLHQAERGEPREAHVVQEDDVEVSQPVEAAKVPEKVKTGDAWGGRTVRAPRSWGHPGPGSPCPPQGLTQCPGEDWQG